MTSAVTIRVDNDLKTEVEELFDDIGLNMTTAITCFLKKCVDTGAIPFTLARQKRSAREETLMAFDEAKRLAHDPNAPRCTDINKLHDFLLS